MTWILFVTDLFWESYLTLMFLSLHICQKGLITYFSLKLEKLIIGKLLGDFQIKNTIQM